MSPGLNQSIAMLYYIVLLNFQNLFNRFHSILEMQNKTHQRERKHARVTEKNLKTTVEESN